MTFANQLGWIPSRLETRTISSAYDAINGYAAPMDDAVSPAVKAVEAAIGLRRAGEVEPSWHHGSPLLTRVREHKLHRLYRHGVHAQNERRSGGGRKGSGENVLPHERATDSSAEGNLWLNLNGVHSGSLDDYPRQPVQAWDIEDEAREATAYVDNSGGPGKIGAAVGNGLSGDGFARYDGHISTKPPRWRR
jgi:hypothetical protein